jgi:HEAT repeat protein
VLWFIWGGNFFGLPGFVPQKVEVPRNDEQLTQVLALTQEADGWRRKDAFEALARAPVLEHRRQEVLERAIEHVNDGNGFTRDAARQTVRHWTGPGSVPALLKLLDNSDGGVRQLGLDLLAKQPVDEARRAEVTNKVLGRIKQHNDLNRDVAKPLVKKWANHDSVPALIDLLDHNDAGVRQLALEVLGGLRDPRALERVWLRLGPDREHASKALQSYGPMAEEMVLQSAKDNDAGIRIEACRILNRIGTARCLPTLQQLQADRDRNVQTAAREALVAVNARLKK